MSPELTELGPSELSDALTSVRHSLVRSALVATVDTCLASIHSNGVIVHDGSRPTTFVREVIAAYSECLTPDALERLRATPVFCHDLPLCNAVARRSSSGRPFILFYSGLLSVAKYRQSVAIIASNLEYMLEQKSNDLPRAKQALGELIAPAQALSYWFYLEQLQLPEFDSVFCDAHKTQLAHGLGCAVMFVALHELGHIVLGHLDGQQAPSAQIATNYIDEDINTWKMMEFAADEFAISGIKPSLRMSFITSVFIILDLISDIECSCFPRTETHPYVLNRVNNLASALGLENDRFYSQRTHSLLSQKKALLAERAKVIPSVSNEHLERQTTIAIDTLKQSLPTPQECLVALGTLKSLYDGVDYLGPNTEAEYAAQIKELR
jgi:hypothetical protein